MSATERASLVDDGYPDGRGVDSDVSFAAVIHGFVNGSPQEFCNDEQPHEPHEFLVGPRRFQCPGLPFGGTL